MTDLQPHVASVALATLGGICATVLALVISRRRAATSESEYADLLRPYLVILACLAVAGAGHVVAELRYDEVGAVSNWIAMQLLFVPWVVFGLHYAGRGYLLTRRRVVGMVLLALVLVGANVRLLITGESSPLGPLVGVLVLVVPALVFVTAGFVLLASHRHENVPLTSGLLLVLPMLLFIFTGQGGVWVAPSQASLLTALTIVVSVGLFGLAALRYDVITTRPGTSTIGERAIVEELSEPVLITGRTGEIGRANALAKETFGHDIPGESLRTVLGADLDTLAEQETIESRTEEGRKQFDPRISTLTNDRGAVLGHTVTLVDVTEREHRRQRIEVLNRILRHNVRNNLDVINTHAELAAEDGRVADHSESILDSTAEIEQLSREARHIEKLLRRSTADDPSSETELEGIVETVVEGVSRDHPAADLTVDVPPVTLSADSNLLEHALRHVVENAVEHNGSETPRVEVRGEQTQTGVRIVVADDGPGIPEWMQEIIEGGTETQRAHAVGIGLWTAKWAIERLGGHISFGESELGGAAVTLHIPE